MGSLQPRPHLRCVLCTCILQRSYQMNHFCIHRTSTELFLRIWPVLAMPRTLALGRNRTEPNVMLLLLPLLHKVNGRFSINHRTTNTGMAAEEEKGGRMEIAPSSRDRRLRLLLCPHSTPDLQSIWGVGPISAPLASFLFH